MLNVAPETEEPAVYDFGIEYQKAENHFQAPATQAAIAQAMSDQDEKTKKTRDLLTVGAGLLLVAALERIVSKHIRRREVFILGTGKAAIGDK